LYEKSKAIALALPGLMAAWQAGRQNSAEFKIFKIIYQIKLNIQVFAMCNKGAMLLQIYQYILADFFT